MVRDAMETETLAQLYLDQGHPDRAARIFEKLLSEDPGRKSAVIGLARCRAQMAARQAEGGMQAEKRLRVLRELLSRLTGVPGPVEATPQAASVSPAEASPVTPASEGPPMSPVSEDSPMSPAPAPVKAQEPAPQPEQALGQAPEPEPPARPADPRQRRLEILKSMLQ